jgi:hypothetical protein
VDRPGIPRSYGTSRATAFIDWSHVEKRVAADRVDWLAAVGEDGRPSVRPIDGPSTG